MGKTVAMVNFVERMPYHRTMIISPTMHSNRDIMKRLKIDPDDIFDPEDDKVLDKIKDKIDQEAKEYEDYLEDLKKWNSFESKLKSSNSLFSDGELMSFYKGGEFKKPTHKYGGEKPCLSLVCDDILGSNLLTKGSRKLNHMVILHRHLGELKKSGGALGCAFWRRHTLLNCAVWAVALCASSKSLINSTSCTNFGWHMRMDIPRCALEYVGMASPGLKLRLAISLIVTLVKKGALSMSIPVRLLHVIIPTWRLCRCCASSLVC